VPLPRLSRYGSASRSAGASAMPGSVPARLSMAEMPAAVWVRDGAPLLRVLGSMSAIFFAYRGASPVSSIAQRVPSHDSHFFHGTT
jgi:hypothetical protein